MNIKQKRSSKTKLIAVLTAVFVLACVGGFAFAAQQRASVSAEKNSRETEVSMFTFDTSSGWRQGPSNETSMAVFSPAQADGTSACFTSAEYYDGAINVADAVQKEEVTIKEGGNAVTLLGVQTLTINTRDGEKQYELHQYKIDSSGPNPLMGGHAIAYLPYKNGHLKIYANCNTAQELPTTISALEAYKIQHD